jgi:hypothetical protein
MAATVQLVSCVVIESSFDPGERLQAPGSLWFLLEHRKFLLILSLFFVSMKIFLF